MSKERWLGGGNFPTLCTCYTERPRPDLCPIHNPGEVTRRLMEYPFEAIGKVVLSDAEQNNRMMTGDRRCSKIKRLVKG